MHSGKIKYSKSDWELCYCRSNPFFPPILNQSIKQPAEEALQSVTWTEQYQDILFYKKPEKTGEYLDNNNCAPSFLRSLCENRRWLFWTEVFFWGSAAPEEKYRGPKQSPTNSHNDRNKDGAKLLLSLTTATLTISCVLCVFFWQKHEENSIFYHFCTHPCKQISINPDVAITARCDKRANTGCIARVVCAFTLTREWKCQRHTQKSLSKVIVTW